MHSGMLYDDPLKQSRSSMKSHDKLVNPTQHVPIRIAQEKAVIVEDESAIDWSNLIFLPFHPVFQMFVLCVVFVKVILGPIQAVFPIVYCNDAMDYHPLFIFIKYIYRYLCDSLYGIDTFLHIVHRQVTDKAVRREHLPKAARLLLCDILALIPIYRLVQENTCPTAKVWPNLLAFNEFLIIYRVANYFQLLTTHSYMKIAIGYTVMLLICLNCITCFWLLLTAEGFCARCNEPNTFYDWRSHISHKLHEVNDRGYATYVYAFTYIFSFTQNSFYDDETKPSAILEFVMTCFLLAAGYLLSYFIVLPKSFAEAMLRLRRVCNKYECIKKIINETQRRNPNTNAHIEVENQYKMIWRKRGGIIKVPDLFIDEIPRYLRLEIKQDLLWPLFYHSPTLRQTSYPFRRWIGETVMITHKYAGSNFFTGALSNSNLYYLKSGIVEILSDDDGQTPILSCTSGTVFGDINFYIPHGVRKVSARCLTFCELYYVQRKCIIQALHKYPEDRNDVMAAVKDRIEHAKVLYGNKQYIKGFDRNEDEGVAWIKRRWWQVHDLIHKYAKLTGKTKEQIKFDLPHEETVYHCSKYIGQLVLCTPTELQTKSMFTKSSFPWILNPYSNFGLIWHRIFTVHLYLVLWIYPPYLIRPVMPEWFILFSYWIDTIYAADVAVSLLTAVDIQDNITSTFATVAFERFKSLTFMLDVISSLWIENIATLIGSPQYYYTLQFNRLIRLYRLFFGTYEQIDIKTNPLVHICQRLALTQIVTTVLSSHIVLEMSNYLPNLKVINMFGRHVCSKVVTTKCQKPSDFIGVSILWTFEWTYTEFVPDHLIDNYVGMSVSYINYLITLYTTGRFVSYLYLKNKEILSYQRFAVSLKKYYEHYRIHQDLLKRLDRYLICHWKYYKGIDVMFSNELRNEPHSVYWLSQGAVAERIIKGSGPFEDADPGLIKELACTAKFLLMPRKANIINFGTISKNVVWVVQGYVKSEYHDEQGELQSVHLGTGTLLATNSVFLGKAALRTYSAYTECEIAYISVHDFWSIYRRYSIEYRYVETCAKEFAPQFDVMFKKHVLKHRDYQTKLRDRIYSTRMSMISTSKVLADIQDNRSLPFEGLFWGQPESSFMKSWFLFRTVIAYISMVSAALLGGVGSVSRWIFFMILSFCNCITYIDIVMKLFLAYHDDRGLLITSKRKCLMHYLTRAFLLDIIGAFPWYQAIDRLMSTAITDSTHFLINTVCKYAHMYIVFAYFEYIADMPTVNVSLLMIVKWQLVNLLIVLGASHYFMVKCVDFVFDNEMYLINVRYLQGTCWMPDYLRTDIPEELKWEHLHLMFAQSLNIAECGMFGMNTGRFFIDRRKFGVGVMLFALGVLFWFITCYTITLLVLGSQQDDVYHHSVIQLLRFLKSERVEKNVIDDTIGHFRYCWIRNQGRDMQKLSNERIGVMFRQDLNYYFYKKTFTILDSTIKCGEATARQLASNSVQAFFLAGHDIFREMDLVPTVCIVHRGRVNITKDGRKIVILSKGDIFGQLVGTKLKPVKVTATAEDMVDLLYINVADFQNIISEEVKRNIARSPQQRSNFMATRNIFLENPYDTVQYILRGRKAIHLPRCAHTTESRHGTWYSYCLYLMWFISPFLTTILVTSFIILPPVHEWWGRIYILLIILDIVHILNFIGEFFTVELTVVRNKVVPKRLGKKRLKYWFLYVDALSLLIPLLTLVLDIWAFQLARLVRLKWYWDFHVVFCKNFRSHLTPIFLKLSIIIMLVHVFSCGLIHVFCREEKFPITIRDMRQSFDVIDFSQWMHPDDRKSGCSLLTRVSSHEKGWAAPSFIVPRYWENDYILAVTNILLAFTQTAINTIMAMTTRQVYYKVFVTYVMYLVDLWVVSMALITAYNRYREMYKFDYEVHKILIYLKACGLCPSLMDTFLTYSAQLWRRQKGDKLPQLAYEAPLCLRQDLFSALYMHHLEAAPTFRILPDYFKRQLVSRFQRVVVFPGKCIVREGDTFNVTYFIHEGEVEKWYNDISGEGRLQSVLYTNGYFGCVAGLFINAGFKFSYYARTVVDLMVLYLHKWEDLLDGYPDVKAMLYEATTTLKKEAHRNPYSLR